MPHPRCLDTLAAPGRQQGCPEGAEGRTWLLTTMMGTGEKPQDAQRARDRERLPCSAKSDTGLGHRECHGSSHLHCGPVPIPRGNDTCIINEMNAVILSRNTGPWQGTRWLRLAERMSRRQSSGGCTDTPCGGMLLLKASPFFPLSSDQRLTHPQCSVTPDKLEEEGVNGRKNLQVFLAFFSYIPQGCQHRKAPFHCSVMTPRITFPLQLIKLFPP